ncbi:cell division protein FtsL [Atopobacter phocae]|uniref:cell division protein FtsL n=1 Tax=Atopobacter phocae TaxID=136492 RepID=UPI000470DCE4|nr:cell division protein FtsL [Atopobacter phocae]
MAAEQVNSWHNAESVANRRSSVRAKQSVEQVNPNVVTVYMGLKLQMWLIIISSFVFLMIITLGINWQLHYANRNLLSEEAQIEQLQLKQKELEEEFDTLSRYERISKIAKERGMELNEEQIRTINHED